MQTSSPLLSLPPYDPPCDICLPLRSSFSVPFRELKQGSKNGCTLCTLLSCQVPNYLASLPQNTKQHLLDDVRIKGVRQLSPSLQHVTLESTYGTLQVDVFLDYETSRTLGLLQVQST